jgi:CMP-N-acetylneuraminic acid synthetase
MSTDRRFLGVIPARGGSKGIPRKNLVSVAGKPLLAYTVEAALGSRLLDRVLLSTDDEEIAEVGRRLGLEVPFLRPAELAGDDAPMMAVIRHAVGRLESVDGYRPTAVVLLQPTSPLRTAAHIDAAIELFLKEDADSVVSVSEPLEHPCDMAWFDNGTMHLALSAEERWKGRQTYPIFHFVNGAIYIVKTELIETSNHPWGGKAVPFLMSPLESIDVDGQSQLTMVDLLISQKLKEGAPSA